MGGKLNPGKNKPASKKKVKKPTPNRTKTAAGTSYLMQVVYEHLPLAQQLDTQLVKRRWFRDYDTPSLPPYTLLRLNWSESGRTPPTSKSSRRRTWFGTSSKSALPTRIHRRLENTGKTAITSILILDQRWPNSATREFWLQVGKDISNAFYPIS
jgi:hypothetical protein